MTTTTALLLMAAALAPFAGWLAQHGLTRLWLWLDRARVRGPVGDDADGCAEYRDAAIIAWSSATWAELDREAS